MYRIAVVGRPNTGKSTLFNRLTDRGGKALTDDTPGVTRDRREGVGRLADLSFTLIDTAGIETLSDSTLSDSTLSDSTLSDSTSSDSTPHNEENKTLSVKTLSVKTLSVRIRQQTEKAIAEADLILLVFDARAGVTPADRVVASGLRRFGRDSIILLANKCEGRAGKGGSAEGYSLGFGTPLAISAAHGEGLGDLYDAIIEVAQVQGRLAELTTYDEGGEEGGENPPMRIAVIGRPNMGKSTLVNRLLGNERMVTGAESGITRDAIEIPLNWHNTPLMLIDTAGIRRRTKIDTQLEKAMIESALRTVRLAHICVLMVDITTPLGKQDLALAQLVAKEGRVLIIAANKCDIVTDKHKAITALRHRLDQSLGQVKGIRLCAISALTGEGIDGLMEGCFDIYGRWNKRIETAPLNRWLAAMLDRHPPPMIGGRRVRIRYITQVKSRPPTFALFISKPKDLPKHYRRYLDAGLREAFGLEGVPLRLLLRKGKNPYDP